MNDTAEETLKAASNTVELNRRRYGAPNSTLSTIAKLWSAAGFTVGDFPVSAEDVCLAMILLKVGRQTNASNADNWVDIAGYAACGAEVDDNE